MNLGKLNVFKFHSSFYINEEWKIAFTSNSSYNSKQNFKGLDGKEEFNSTMRDIYLKSIASSTATEIFGNLSEHTVLALHKRAQIHCENEISDHVELICTKNDICMFDPYNDPCEIDNYSQENAYRNEKIAMIEKMENFLIGGSVNQKAASDVDLTERPFDRTVAWKMGLILFIIVFSGIFGFILVVCYKEKCNTKRSVYNRSQFIDQSDSTVPECLKNSPISVISKL